MILYTVASAEEIFGNQSGAQDKKVTMKVKGGLVEGVRYEGGVRVERLITTDLKMYLDKRFEIGKILQ